MEVLRVLALGSVKEEGDDPAERRTTTRTQHREINSLPWLSSGGSALLPLSHTRASTSTNQKGKNKHVSAIKRWQEVN